MPIYSYRCFSCGQAFDRLLKPGELKDVQACPHCKGPTDRQVTAPAGFDLKGSGWYSRGNQ